MLVVVCGASNSNGRVSERWRFHQFPWDSAGAFPVNNALYFELGVNDDIAVKEVRVNKGKRPVVVGDQTTR